MKDTFSAALGVYDGVDHAGHAVTRLISEGFSKDEISVLLIEDQGAIELTHDKYSHEGKSSSVVLSSVALGGTIGLLAGFAAVAIPGIGAIVGAGPLLGALAGFGTGGLVGGLIDAAALPEDTAKRYEDHLKAGRALIAVHCRTLPQVLRAKYLLTATNAEDVSNTGPLPE